MADQQKQFILSLLAYAAHRDVSTKLLCMRANIDLTALKKNDAYKITQKQFNDLWFHASQLTHDHLFGLHFGESAQLAALGVVGEIIKHSKTVGEAVTIAASLSHLVSDLFQMKIVHSKKTFAIQLIPSEKPGADFGRNQMRDFLMVFIIHELDGLVLEKIKPEAVYFPFRVSDAHEYERVLRCRPSRKDQFAIHFDRMYWDEEIISSDYELQTFLMQKVHAFKMADGERFSEKVTQYLMRNSYLGIFSLEEIAANFNITSRSLQRRLQEEGTTFQQLADAVKKTLALHYVESGKHPIKEISALLGYNELSAFSRAFKRWTGKAPANYLS